MEAALDIIGAKSKRQKAKSRKTGERRKVKGERYLYCWIFTIRDYLDDVDYQM
jgi:hypothetical protein